jgi:hypothetical protein
MSDISVTQMAAMLEEASTRSIEERFLASLSQEVRDYCKESVRMQSDFLQNVQRMLTSTSQAEVLLYSDRVRSSAMEVAHRWGMYRYMLRRYAELDVVRSFRVEVPSE